MLLLAAKPSPDFTFIDWVFFIIREYWPQFLKGAGVTLLIAITSTILGSLIGLAIGSVRTIPIKPNNPLYKKVILRVVNALLAVYIEVFRGTPMMVQAMLVFYGFAYITGRTLDTLVAGIAVVAINTGAYMAEIVRGGIEAIDRGQTEAAHAIGMTHGQTMLNVILPQTIRNILPATGNEFVINIKDTSVLSVISITELFFVSKSVAGKYMALFQTMVVTCAVYLVLTFTITRLLRFLEKKMDGSQSYTIHGSHTITDTEIKVPGKPGQR